MSTQCLENQENLLQREIVSDGTFWDSSSQTAFTSEIQSIEVGTVSAVEDMKKLLHQDLLGVKPTQLCSCSENVSRESKFMKSLAASTTLVDGRIQVKLPWKEGEPPKRSNCNIGLKRMFSAEKSFEKKGCFKVVVRAELCEYGSTRTKSW